MEFCRRSGGELYKNKYVLANQHRPNDIIWIDHLKVNIMNQVVALDQCIIFHFLVIRKSLLNIIVADIRLINL